ncbi:hypothetical protein EYZ11_006876 [Aspergillus tanneri]|uniref:Tautomerase cis-CaaD-like domain-containing protein n=1 Tax=Aspergillus tanneri TaxID=1220188 RepID=A0A4V3UP45_9EURO|nr:uncharacterized protein ATNIH1004_006373 [Aspergillus tanneri]KAA8647679.1 hypothetical protein ATNIH1004_006373 [Aspergillus tanneri]THC93664.1 hypothetical protein EYZ11_006876 [Aspergillus tanneri]
MPRWTFHLSSGILSDLQKDQLANAITEIYTNIGFPAFWVNVFFNESPTRGYYVGGKHKHRSVFLIVDHAAQSFGSEETRLNFLASIDKIVRPIFEPQNIDWELNVYEHPSDNWRINGMIPPVGNPVMLEKWVQANKPVPF